MALDIRVVEPAPPRRHLHHALGLVILALNALRHRIQGYTTPRPWMSRDAQKLLDYDRAVFENWQTHLVDYLSYDLDLRDRHVLEIGPGSDLGTGLLWLAAGAASYTAIDAHPLIHKNARSVHEELADLVGAGDESIRLRLHEALELLHRDEDGPLRYRVLSGFDLDRLDLEGFDLVVSHSAFEHIENVQRSLAQISERVTERAHLVAEIDLQTHTRWIRDADPLNIYRFSPRVYRTLGFSGIPNRVRPDEYLAALEKAGWLDLRVYPKRVLDADYVAAVEPGLHCSFQGDPERLGWLSMVVCASRAGERSWKVDSE